MSLNIYALHISKIFFQYEVHLKEKVRVRELKDIGKHKAIESESTPCASFDLQQVIYSGTSVQRRFWCLQKSDLVENMT